MADWGFRHHISHGLLSRFLGPGFLAGSLVNLKTPALWLNELWFEQTAYLAELATCTTLAAKRRSKVARVTRLQSYADSYPSASKKPRV